MEARTCGNRPESLAVRTKRKVYGSPDEFDTDRKKMWSKGWLVLDHRAQRVVRPSWSALGPSASLAILVVMSPLLLLGWLIYRHAPDEEIVVTYGRREM